MFDKLVANQPQTNGYGGLDRSLEPWHKRLFIILLHHIIVNRLSKGLLRKSKAHLERSKDESLDLNHCILKPAWRARTTCPAMCLRLIPRSCTLDDGVISAVIGTKLRTKGSLAGATAQRFPTTNYGMSIVLHHSNFGCRKRCCANAARWSSH